MTSRAGRVLGIDVGGTKISFGWVGLPGGGVEGGLEIPTRAERPGKRVLEDVVASAHEMGIGPDDQIGLAICELVDHGGQVTSGQTVDWTGLDLAAAFAPTGRLVLSSDVRAGALAEARLGAGRDLESFLFVSVGTGISATLVVGGVPWAGANGNALVLATGASWRHCPVCGKDSAVVAEEVASGGGMKRRLAEMRPDLGIQGAEDVVAMAERGEPEAVEVVSAGADTLGELVGWAVNLLDPHAVVMGGGLGLADGMYRRRFLESLRRHVWAESSRDVPVRDAGLGTGAVMVGAALAVAQGRPA